MDGRRQLAPNLGRKISSALPALPAEEGRRRRRRQRRNVERQKTLRRLQSRWIAW